ncbi:hypothetical protein POJ06DRAFT_279740 [Lipomyces tetrasporus]|uniref:Uncharacterized protein n=1 Tax=Lipomyces tetrasporus TaxID=54092 RepID=A0AAD7QZF5_9ASCO|nr:uncharacterized protein POJ06DRAFT_279740 [Lipomyces tetrasporus]KAJ8104249.1 hypothetical protein POJ06DRAFT_279740 [Lipomyces tetrasporus]
MSLSDREADRRSYANAREAAWRLWRSRHARATAPETRQRARLKEGPMEIEISEVLEVLRRPLLSDSVLEFIVSEDGYKRIIEDREKCNRKYRVWYDGETHKVTINCCPSYLREHTSLIVINSMVDEAVRVMRNAGVSDFVISSVKKAGHLTSSSLSRKKSYKEPDGLITFDDLECVDAHRIAVEATLWWIEQKVATIAVLLCLTEVGKSSGEAHRYNGYTWFGTLHDAFFETYLETDSGVVKSEPHLVKDGVDVTEILRDLTVKVGDFVPHNWLSDDVVRRLAVNFLQPQTFMEGLSNAIVRTTLNRANDTFEVEEH